MIEPSHPDLIPPAKIAPTREKKESASRDAPVLRIHLERVFHGPLDLLLQLVRDKELEIHEVALAQVCETFCAHVRALECVDVDEAADYLVLAATLLAIKSRSLLPQEELEEEEDPFLPGAELVEQLLVYKELRQVAEVLGERWAARSRLLPAGGHWLGPAESEETEEDEVEWELGEISIWDLLQVFRRLERETGFLRPHRVRHPGKPLAWYVEEVWKGLAPSGELSLREVFRRPGVTRGDAAYYLVALLELARQQAIDLEQVGGGEDIRIRRVSEAAEVHFDQLDQSFDHHPLDPEPEVEELFQGAEQPESDSAEKERIPG